MYVRRTVETDTSIQNDPVTQESAVELNGTTRVDWPGSNKGRTLLWLTSVSVRDGKLGGVRVRRRNETEIYLYLYICCKKQSFYKSKEREREGVLSACSVSSSLAHMMDTGYKPAIGQLFQSVFSSAICVLLFLQDNYDWFKEIQTSHSVPPPH